MKKGNWRFRLDGIISGVLVVWGDRASESGTARDFPRRFVCTLQFEVRGALAYNQASVR